MKSFVVVVVVVVSFFFFSFPFLLPLRKKCIKEKE